MHYSELNDACHELCRHNHYTVLLSVGMVTVVVVAVVVAAVVAAFSFYSERT